MSNVNEIYGSIKELFTEFDENHSKFNEKGNKAAGARARKSLGELADLSCIECIITSDRARSELGWLPIAPSVATELSRGTYRTGPLVPYSH